MTEPLNRAPLEAVEILRERLTKLLREDTPEGWGFCLAFCSMADGGYIAYSSSMTDDSTADLLRLLAKKIHDGNIQKDEDA